MTISKGLVRLGFHPKNDFELLYEDGVTTVNHWFSDLPQPSESEIKEASNAWQAEFNSQEFARKRKAEYPSVDELVVALWEGVVEERMASVTKLEIKRQAVKAKHPK
jgi:hypothetical protein